MIKLNNNPDGMKSFQLKSKKNNLNEQDKEKSSVASFSVVKQETTRNEQQDENPEEPEKPDESESETDKSENNDDENTTQPEIESDNGSDTTIEIEESTSDQEKGTKFGIVGLKKREELILRSRFFTTMANTATNGNSYRCDVCFHICATIEDLEQHKSLYAHYACNIGPNCSIGFSSQAELTNHQVEHQDQHPEPQLMEQQVERIPFNYNYRQISNQEAQKRKTAPPETPPTAKRERFELPDSKILVKNRQNSANVSAKYNATRGVIVDPSSSIRLAERRETSKLATIDLTNLAIHRYFQAEHQDQHPVPQMVQQVERIPFNYNYRQIKNQPAQKRKLTPPVAKRLLTKLPYRMNNDDKNSTQPEIESDNGSDTTIEIEESTSDQEKGTKFGIVGLKKREELILRSRFFTTMANTATNGNSYRCDVCLHICATIDDLEQHKSSNLHYACDIGPNCSIGFSSQAELTNHQAEHQDQHPEPQLIEQQVERIPFNYNYRQISNQEAQKRKTAPPETPPTAKRVRFELPDSKILVKNRQNSANVSAKYNATRGVIVDPSSSIRLPPSRETSKLPTIDLTKAIETPRRRGALPIRSACQMCDKVFPSRKVLSAHMRTHFECELCTAQYPSALGLKRHKKKFHPNLQNPQAPLAEMALPFVDIGTPEVKKKLLQAGVRHVLMLTSFGCEQGSACFGLPIVPVDTANNQAYCLLGDVGSSNMLRLGTFQPQQ